MNGIAEALSSEEIAAVAGELARRVWEMPGSSAGADPDRLSRGADLAGRARCASCHGDAFEGWGRSPRLRGQSSAYLKAQLQAFRGFERSNDLGAMFAVTRLLSDRDLEDLAEYLGFFR